MNGRSEDGGQQTSAGDGRDDGARLQQRVTVLEREVARLQAAERRLAMLTETLPIGVGVTRMDGTIVYANRTGAAQQGMTLEELIGARSQDLFDDPAERDRLVAQLQAEGRVDDFETWWRARDGRRRRMRLTSQPVQLEGEACIMGTGQDITHHYETRERLAAIADAGPVAITIARRADGVVVYANAPLCHMLGADETQLLGRPSPDFWVDPDRRRLLLQQVDAQGELRGEEIEIVDASGRRFWVSADIVALQLDGKPCIMKALVDIDEAKRTRNALSRALDEQALLLRELNHRVRNNLQIVNGILNMHLNDGGDDGGRAALAECGVRIRAMSALHDALVRQPAVSRVSMASLLHGLVPHLRRAYLDDDTATELHVEGEVVLHMEQAMPCGLLVNELLTNALRHAFPDGVGHVWVRLRGRSGQAELEVCDDGVGLPSESPRGATGMRLVSALAGQLGGEVRWECDDGIRSIRARYAQTCVPRCSRPSN